MALSGDKGRNRRAAGAVIGTSNLSVGGMMGAGLPALAVLLLWPTGASSQSAAPGASTDLPPLVVESTAPRPAAKRKKSTGAPSAGTATASQGVPEDGQGLADSGASADPAAEAASTLDAIPGGTAVVTNAEMTPKASAS
ncbi:MAG: hypothetical protein F9K43_26880, partial [Bauldia sp.]